MIEFQGYIPIVVQMLNACIKDPHRCMAVMYIDEDKKGRLDFIQNMEYKFVELLSLEFSPATEVEVSDVFALSHLYFSFRIIFSPFQMLLRVL
jgi:hypothetical protein